MTRLNEAIARYRFQSGIPTMADAGVVIAESTRIKPRRILRLRRGNVRMFTDEAEQLAAALSVPAEWLAFGENAPGWAR